MLCHDGRIPVFAAAVQGLVGVICSFDTAGIMPNAGDLLVQLVFIQRLRALGNGKGAGSYVPVGESHTRYLVDRIFNTVFAHAADAVYPKLKGVTGLRLQMGGKEDQQGNARQSFGKLIHKKF